MKKFRNILLWVFSAGITVCLFAGGLSFIGYLVAIIIGGEAAPVICSFIYKTYLPWVIIATSVFSGIGLLGMYFSRQKALTVSSENVNQTSAQK